ncbi:MAG: YraN family protein [Thermoguttaceae bacterium]|nr:YraN family protein [Thermoguttaceae bacterium]
MNGITIMSKRRKGRSFLSLVGLIIMFIPLCFVGICKTVVIGTVRFFSQTLMSIEPALWRLCFGKRRRGNRFEDYSERRTLANKSVLLPKDELGLAGERLVFERVRRFPNCEVLACNVENYYCEIDLIYLDQSKREIVFVEVKTRRRENLAHPTLEAVDAKRRKKIALAAREFVRQRGYIDYRRRYDVAIVIWPSDELPEVSFYENAFKEVDAIREYKDVDYGKNRAAAEENA